MVDDGSTVDNTAVLDVRPATAQDWDDVTTVLGTRGDPSRCWCQWFRLRNVQWQATTAAQRRDALREQLAADPPPGVLAYRGGEPVGWAGVAPRPAYPRIAASTVLSAALRQVPGDDPSDPAVWALTCFVVRTEHRRQGVAGALLEGAVELARVHGARVVEAYPVDVAAKPRVSSSELYKGSLNMFLQSGFREVARSGAAKAVVRRDLAART